MIARDANKHQLLDMYALLVLVFALEVILYIREFGMVHGILKLLN